MGKDTGDADELRTVKWIEKNSIEGFSLDTNLYLRDIYTEVIKAYKDTEYTVNEKGTIKRLSYNTPVILEILFFILKTDKSLLKNLSVIEREFLSNLEENPKMPFARLVEWFNVHGDNILDNINVLSKTDKVPEHLRARIFDESLIGKYTPLQVCQDIEKNLTKQTNYVVTYSNDGYTKNIDVSINLKEKSQLSEPILDKIMRTIMLVPKLNINKISDTPVKLNIYSSSAKKQCAIRKPRILGSNNINSGVSVFKFSESLPIITTVYRSEEMHKLLIHELIHTYKYDFGFIDFSLKISDFINISRDTKLTPNEAYTEVVTLILNTAAESFNFTETPNYDLFKVMLEYEAQFSLLQCAKILNYYEFTSVEDFFQPYDNRNRFKQNTNVFSYFFIKTALLVNTAELLNFFERYTNKLYLKKGNKYYIKSEFEKLMIKSLKRHQFQKGLAHFFKKIRNGKENGLITNKHICKTLRMTVFG
jgi:hypothetical protein